MTDSIKSGMIGGKSLEALDYLKLGNEKLKTARLYDALTFYNKVISQDPDNISALISKGIILGLANNAAYSKLLFEQALKICTDNMDKRDEYVEIWIERAYFSETLKYPMAISLYRYANSLNPDDIFVLGRLLILYKCCNDETNEADIMLKLNYPGQMNHLCSVIHCQ